MSHLPHDEVLEESVLGLIFLSHGRILADIASDLTEEFFYAPKTRALFSHSRNVFERGAFSISTVLGSIRTTKDRDSLDSSYVTRVARSMASMIGAEELIANLRAYTTLRRGDKLRRDIERSVKEAMDSVDPMLISAMVAEWGSDLATVDAAVTRTSVMDRACDTEIQRLEMLLDGKQIGRRIGVHAYDAPFMGMMPDRYHVVGARQGVGKSSLMEMAAETLLAEDIPCCIFALDMAADMMLSRMACRFLDLSKYSLDQGLLKPHDIRRVIDRVEYYRKSKLRLPSVSNITPDGVGQLMNQERAKYGCEYFFFDVANAVKSPPREERHLTLGRLSSVVRDRVNSLHVYMMMLAHLNRSGAGNSDDRPRPEHIRECDALLGDCDGLMLMWSKRSEVDAIREKGGAKIPVYFSVGKNRNGPFTEMETEFDGTTMTFRDAP